MKPEAMVLAVDIGTTGAKVCLYRLGAELELAASAREDYPIRILPDGGAEQDPEDWWTATCRGTRRVVAESGIPGSFIRGMAFCCQMQGLVLVDEGGRPVRPAMSYMDQRAREEKRRGIEGGLRIAGMDLSRLIPSLVIAGGVSASAKDPVWKYQWVRNHEPERFARARKWLDVKEYLVGRATGRFAMTPDSANATFLYDSRTSRGGWSPLLCRLFEVDPAHLPELIRADEAAGPLLSGPAGELGLEAGVPVFGGGGDLSLIALGSGAVGLGEAHVYMGTSGWVAAAVDRRIVDTATRSAAVLGALPGRYNYISEQETSGKCMEWVRDHLALDEIGLYLDSHGADGRTESGLSSIFELLDETAESVAPGAKGVVFAPWLRGSRSPFEDPDARGIFFNIGLDTGKRHLVRAVVEGLALQARWQLEAIRRRVETRGALRLVGGGARSRAIGRILAEVLGERVEVPEEPENAGALGAAMVCAAGLKASSSLEAASRLVRVGRCYEALDSVPEVYERHFRVLKRLYYRNRENFRELNALQPEATLGGVQERIEQ